MAPQGAAYHVDWIFSNTSNVHVATHRDWFTIFTEFKSETETGAAVLGIGAVELDVKTHLNRKGSKSHRKITLSEVLFVPSYLCNILGGPIFEDFNIIFPGANSGLRDKKTGGSAGLFDQVVLPKLWLVGHQKGKTSLDPDGLYWINARWPAQERAKWQVYGTLLLEKLNRLTVADETAQPTKLSQDSVDDYTSAEKAWLKRAFGGEFKFLASHGLNIHKEEGRAEGRSIARAMIEKEAAQQSDDEREEAEDDDDDDGEDDEEENHFLKDLEEDPASHLADRFFSEDQLDWIEKHYRHSGNFLIIHGLKAWEDEDCKEGVAIARLMMSDDEDND